jgi:hypothetical protein
MKNEGLMKLNHDEFVALLAVALESDEKEASGALSAWVDAVTRETEEKGFCAVEGLGAFRRADDGLMEFQPDDVLALEVNYKFAGLRPIEVSPPASSPTLGAGGEEEEPGVEAGKSEQEIESGAEDVEHREDEEPVFEPDEVEPDEVEPDEVEPDEVEPDEVEPDEVEPEWKPEPEFEPEIEPEPEYEPDTEPEPELAGSGMEDEETSSRSFTLPKLSLSQKLKARSGASKNRRRSATDRLAWLIPVAAILIVAVLLYFHFDGQRLSRTHIDDRPIARQEVPVPAPRDDREQEPAGQEFVPSPDPVEDVAPPPDAGREPEMVNNVAADPADEVIRDLALPYGLKGPEDEVLIGAYTIVVHSLRNERKSEIEKQRLENQGFKATQWSAVLPNGNATYRVGIGQFKTVSDAERAIEDLPEPFRSNNFIIRIR